MPWTGGALCLRSLCTQRPCRVRARWGEQGPQHSTGDPPQLRHPGPPPWRRAQASACHTKWKNIPYKTVTKFRLHMVYEHMCVYIYTPYIYVCVHIMHIIHTIVSILYIPLSISHVNVCKICIYDLYFMHT